MDNPRCVNYNSYPGHNLQQNNPELFTEIIEILEGIKNNDKIKEILDTTKIIKSQIQPKNLKRIHTSSSFGENTT